MADFLGNYKNFATNESGEFNAFKITCIQATGTFGGGTFNIYQRLNVDAGYQLVEAWTVATVKNFDFVPGAKIRLELTGAAGPNLLVSWAENSA